MPRVICKVRILLALMNQGCRCSSDHTVLTVVVDAVLLDLGPASSLSEKTGVEKEKSPISAEKQVWNGKKELPALLTHIREGPVLTAFMWAWTLWRPCTIILKRGERRRERDE
jgi:hypothetical protein